MLDTVKHYFDAIPASFWGVVVGSLVSIATVVITNRASEKRLRDQFEYERASKTKDREMALRKEVFLSSAEAISAAFNSISRFGNLDIPNDQITQAYTEKAPALSKAHVIANTETILLLVQFTSRLGALYLELFTRRNELINEKNAILLIDSQIAQFERERDRILELIRQHNIEGIVNQRRWEVLQGNFDFEQKRIGDSLTERAKLVAALQPKHLEFMRQCLLRTRELGEMLVPILTEVRRELELPFDEGAYREAMAESYAQQQIAIDEFIRNFTRALGPNASLSEPK